MMEFVEFVKFVNFVSEGSIEIVKRELTAKIVKRLDFKIAN